MKDVIDAWAAERAAAEALFGLKTRRPGSDAAEARTEVVVLCDEVSVGAVLALADAEGWQLREETSRAHLVLASRRWDTTTGEEVTHVLDHPGGAQSLLVKGTWAAALAKRLRDWLPCHTEDELLDVVLGVEVPDATACVRVASKLAALRPTPCEPRHLAALERLLGHPVDAVRRAGIRSAYGCRWKELRALVERRHAVEARLGAQLEELRRHLDREGDAG
jgi:hypothetical protein